MNTEMIIKICKIRVLAVGFRFFVSFFLLFFSFELVTGKIVRIRLACEQYVSLVMANVLLLTFFAYNCCFAVCES